MAGDCDDRDWRSHPDGVEVCDGRDNDCNGFIDDGAEDAWTWHHDEDGDGLGDPDDERTTCHVPDDAVFNAQDPDDTSPAGSGGCTSVPGPPAGGLALLIVVVSRSGRRTPGRP